MKSWDRSEKVDEPKEEKVEEKKARPVRRRVLHKSCQTVSTLGIERATAFAADEDFDTELYCANEHGRFPVSEFTWLK